MSDAPYKIVSVNKPTLIIVARRGENWYYLEAARPNNNPPIPKPNIIGSQADRIGVKTAFTPIELVMKENT